MSDELKCLRCQTPMEEGFLIDVAHHGQLRQARWCVGKPQPSFWYGEARSGQLDSGRRVATYCCPSCGYLESYAADPKSHLNPH